MSRGLRGSRVGAIARREWLSTVRRREFVLITLGLPLFYALVIAAVVGGSLAASGTAERKAHTAPARIGFRDASGKLNAAALRAGADDYTGILYTTEREGEQAVRDRRVRAFVTVPADFPRNAALTVDLPTIANPVTSADRADDLRAAYTRAIRRALLAGRVDDPTLTAALQPFTTVTQTLDAKTGQFHTPDLLREVSRFAVPYAFSLLLLLSVLFSSSYLLHGIVEEKESRIIETLLAAATHEELLVGKLIGLGGAGLTQLALWVSAGLITPLALPPVRAALAASVTLGILACAGLLFVLGFALYAAILAGIGALGTSWRESQQIAGIAVFALAIPLLFLPVLLEDPNGTLARVLSLVPLTAPIGMMLRVAAGGGSPLDLCLSVALLLAAIAFVIRISARLFRLSLLLVGQRPTPRAIWRALTAR